MQVIVQRQFRGWRQWGLAILVGMLAFNAYADASAVQSVLTSPNRASADRERDQRDKAAEIMGLIQLQPGQNVVDIFAGGGYWSELFAAAVGPTGNVTVHNNAAYRRFVGPDVGLRFAEAQLPQVAIHDREVDDLELGEQQQDVIYLGLSFHDLYFVNEKEGWPAIDAAHFIGQLTTALKPGGRLVIMDHSATAGSAATAAQDLHRIDKGFVIKTLTAAGLELQSQSAVLENNTDTLTTSVFDKSVRGKTSRFLVVFTKPVKG
jgi:predicted methyltransferase